MQAHTDFGYTHERTVGLHGDMANLVIYVSLYDLLYSVIVCCVCYCYCYCTLLYVVQHQKILSYHDNSNVNTNPSWSVRINLHSTLWGVRINTRLVSS